MEWKSIQADRNTIPSLTDHTQSVIFAQVLQADNPVLDARVTATISGPGGDISLQLRNNGLASPDVTEGDGVYSDFILVLARYAGYHSVRVSMERRRTEDHIGGNVK